MIEELDEIRDAELDREQGLRVTDVERVGDQQKQRIPEPCSEESERQPYPGPNRLAQWRGGAAPLAATGVRGLRFD